MQRIVLLYQYFPLVIANSGFESTLSITQSHRSVNLDPSVQHIPLNPLLAHLRPPPPRVPENARLFVGLSVFRDGYRCAKTIFTGFHRAVNPANLVFGVVDQVYPSDQNCLDEYCKLATVDGRACPYKDQIRVDTHSAHESRGPTLARHQQQKLVQDEDFCLQLDSHSIFTNGWDANLLKEWKSIGNEMAVITTYIHHIHSFVAANGDNVSPKNLGRPHLCTTERGGNGLVRTIGASMIQGSKMPQLQALWGAGFSYNKCHAEKRVPVDAYTLWVFDGEEFLRASRLWTHGYDMYSPSELGSVIYHNYTKVPARFEKIKVDRDLKAKESEMGLNRFKLLVGQPFEGRVSTFELNKYGFGTVRSFKQYLEFSGVTFAEGEKDEESCEQRHWVPYTNATEVEDIVGGGWTLENPSIESVGEMSGPQHEFKLFSRLRHQASRSGPLDAISSTPFYLVVTIFATLFLGASFFDNVLRNLRRFCTFQHPSKE